MEKIYKVKLENGQIIFKLEKLLEDKHISKNKIMRDTNTDYKVLKRIWTGEIERIDLTVLARICNYLDCDITDIIEYKKDYF